MAEAEKQALTSHLTSNHDLVDRRLQRAASDVDSAGFVDAYRSRDLSASEMAPIRAALAWTLERHDPFPALALDRQPAIHFNGIFSMSIFHAVVWTDHQSAQVLQFDAEHVLTNKIKAHTHHTKQHGSGVRTEHKFFGDV